MTCVLSPNRSPHAALRRSWLEHPRIGIQEEQVAAVAVCGQEIVSCAESEILVPW